ncbi:hypothetical protein LWP59_15220 [Amycolatopsis acidiphila]|uniref:DUF4878 domain-containing protein n=1 Tax=Amycolatopsis acidiphila TaxID=715473 RepID=A0A558A790_9PSEU|nr:hypothetical protein [Amycolatopsis acidiphila]TVT20106.1 hypothetical protein FNH06_21830 [Amycolatopsis acidiphila]UIJ62873.1 hypothetical protein LWP59_15220 [Amycolatopsis acidiphila]GHG64753.1 hypothetical protein GCM10017788_21710 [Amycolatopsis acidiphila]
MTHPPSGPYGRPGTYGPPSGPYPPPGPYGAGQGGFPPPGQQQQLPQARPPQQPFDPWGRAPGAFDSYGGGSMEGPVGGPPKKKRTGLVAGVIAAVVVLVAGGVTALVLLTGSDDTGGGTAAPAGAPAAGKPAAPTTPASLAQLAVDSLNSRSASQYATLVCAAPSQADITSLQQQWTTATDLHGSVSGAPEVTGATATVQVSVTYNGKTQNSKIPMKQQGQKWCIDES